MTAEEVLQEIMEWVESSHAFLSTRTDYGRGYKDGITRAKEIIEELMEAWEEKRNTYRMNGR